MIETIVIQHNEGEGQIIIDSEYEKGWAAQRERERKDDCKSQTQEEKEFMLGLAFKSRGQVSLSHSLSNLTHKKSF